MKNVLLEKSKEFAILVANNCIEIQQSMQEYDYTKQLKRSSSSIAANVAEAQFAASKKDFLHKLTIALKESNESEFWIELLISTKYIPDASLLSLNKEITKLLISITKTLKTKYNL